MIQMKIGIIGAGRIGKVHAETIALNIHNVEIKGIADALLEPAKEIGDRFGISKVSTDYRDILNDEEIEAVLICSPTDTHSQYVIEATKQGKHIFCEKPLDLSIHRIEMVLEAVEKAGVKLMVGFNRRFDPNFSSVYNMVRAGKIGETHILKITSRDPGPPPIEYIKVSGGMFLDMTIHDFDMARYIVGDEVEEVYSKANSRIDKSIEKAGDVDTAITILYFKNGTIATIDNSRKAVYGYDQRLEIFGSEGMVMIDNNKPDSHSFYNITGSHGPLPLHFFMDRYIESYKIEIESFIDAIINNKEVPASGIDGLAAIQIGLAAKKSVLENRPIKISEIT